MNAQPIRIRRLGRRAYRPVWEAMQRFTDARDPSTPDEAWLVEHSPVFTLGLNGKPEHILAPGEIPVVPVDRGGQVTYHGPGQAMLYLLLDLRRRGWGVRQLVSAMEQSVVALLAEYAIDAAPRADAPGVYVDGAKVAALGLRVRRGCCYHGLALNVAMDLAPFNRINPCGYAGQPVTSLERLGLGLTVTEAGEQLLKTFCRGNGYQAAPAATDELPETA